MEKKGKNMEEKDTKKRYKKNMKKNVEQKI